MTRPLAKTRLQEAITHALGSDARTASTARDLAYLRRILCLISQEKRYLLTMFLKDRNEFLTDYEIAEGIRDARSNVARNLHVLLSEGVVMVKRDPETRIARFRINSGVMNDLAQVFQMGQPCSQSGISRKDQQEAPSSGP
jgi:predicted transcriptional regulator